MRRDDDFGNQLTAMSRGAVWWHVAPLRAALPTCETAAVPPAANDIAERQVLPVRQGLRLVMLGLGISVVPLDTAVNIAFPDITGSFGLPIPMIQWVIICYVLTHAGLMLAFGRVGDIWSHGLVFRCGLAWSAAAFGAGAYGGEWAGSGLHAVDEDSGSERE